MMILSIQSSLTLDNSVGQVSSHLLILYYFEFLCVLAGVSFDGEQDSTSANSDDPV